MLYGIQTNMQSMGLIGGPGTYPLSIVKIESGASGCTWFLVITFVHECMCVCIAISFINHFDYTYFMSKLHDFQACQI